MKYCSKCGETKEYSEFHKMTRSKDGHQNWCKICLRADNKRMIDFRYKNGPTIVRESKTCQRCNMIKPVSQFAKKKSSADWYTSYCKPCWVIIIRGYQVKGKTNGR
jgi:hypothetical protein